VSRRIEVIIYREDQYWVARALNVEVSSFGDSPERARAAIREALELFFEVEEDTDIREVGEPRLETVLSKLHSSHQRAM